MSKKNLFTSKVVIFKSFSFAISFDLDNPSMVSKLTSITNGLVDQLNDLKVGNVSTQGLANQKVIAEISPEKIYQLQIQK